MFDKSWLIEQFVTPYILASSWLDGSIAQSRDELRGDELIVDC